MRCSNCGLPLSPSRTSCPRCGTVHTTSSKKGKSEQDGLPPQAGNFAAGNMSAGPHIQPENFEAGAVYAPQWNAYPAPTFHEAPASYAVETAQQAFPLPDKAQAFFDPSPTIKKQSMPHHVPQQLDQNWHSTPASQTMFQSPNWAPMQPFALVNRDTSGNDQRRQRNMRIGFTAASICLIAGALMLTFVSIMIQPLLPANSVSSQVIHTDASNSYSATASPLSARIPTPHQNLPGAQYINNAHMANAINQGTGQATAYATNFTPNQRIYVTFALNTGSQGGAVCLIWYLNSQYISQYAFPVGKNQLYNSYSYNSMTSAGSGYVEIYWASTVACTDKLLAEHVTFTVS